MTEGEAVKAVRTALNNVVAGRCYSAAEAVYHLMGGVDSGYTPTQVWHGRISHWYLKAPDGRWVDPTEDQFNDKVDHAAGVGRGFLSKQPSRQAKTILDAIEEGQRE